MSTITYSLSSSYLIKEYGDINKLLNVHFDEVITWLTPKIPVDADMMDTT
jgi:hypothetical protein